MGTDKEEAYARRFLRKEWTGVLEIVRWYVQSEFRPEWGRHTDEQQRNAEGVDRQSRQQGLAKAMLEFVKGKEETTDQAVLQQVVQDSDFRQKLDDWLREQYGQSNHQNQGRAALEHAANVISTVGTGASEDAPARRFGSDNDIENQQSRHVEVEPGASRRVESPVDDGPAFQGIAMVQEKGSAPVSGRTGNGHHSPHNRRPLPLSQPDPKSSPSQRAPTSRVIDGHTQRSGHETYTADKRTVSVQNPTRSSSTIVQPSPGAWRKGLKARS
jgi:hypothetical protein